MFAGHERVVGFYTTGTSKTFFDIVVVVVVADEISAAAGFKISHVRHFQGKGGGFVDGV